MTPVRRPAIPDLTQAATGAEVELQVEFLEDLSPQNVAARALARVAPVWHRCDDSFDEGEACGRNGIFHDCGSLCARHPIIHGASGSRLGADSSGAYTRVN